MAVYAISSIGIDDNEVANLRLVLDEIFGRSNFIANFIWEKRKNRENRKVISVRHDYILCFAKNKNTKERMLKMLPMTGEALDRYKNIDNDPRGVWKSDPLTAQSGHATKNQYYTLIAPNGKSHQPPKGRCWIYSEPVMKQAIADNRIWFGEDGNNTPRKKTYLYDKDRGLTPETIWFAQDVSTNDMAKREVKNIFPEDLPFPTPKPVELMERIIFLATNNNDIVLDSFSGSGTTAHAVLDLNKKDCGNRRFICIEMMDYADTITAERIKRVIKGYQYEKDKKISVYDKELEAEDLKEGKDIFKDAEQAQKDAKASGEWDSVSAPKLVDNHLQVIATKKATKEIVGTGGDFSFYELGNQILTDDGVFDASLSVEEIKAFIWQSETHTRYQPLPDGEDGCLGIFNGTAIYAFYDQDQAQYFDLSALRSMKHKAESYVVYAGACLFPEEDLDRKNITFKKIPRDVANK